ncbi:MAG: hypothetical protein JNK05_10105 [Myxococcales bacterium]|nr:hypothetical protein [Myxococcales bacterium]
MPDDRASSERTDGAARRERRALSFVKGRAPAFIVMVSGEALVCTAEAARGEVLVVRVGAVELARSLPLEGSSGSVLVPAERLAPFSEGPHRLDLVRAREERPASERVIGSVAIVTASSLALARALSFVAAVAPASLALFALAGARFLSVRALSIHLVEALLALAPLAVGLRRWPTGMRLVLAFDARAALVAATLAWGIFFVARSQNVVVHNLTGRAEGALPAGRSNWLRFASYASLPTTQCNANGPVCLHDDPRSLIPAPCGDVPEDEPLVRATHAVRFAGCPGRFEHFDATWIRDDSVCQRPIRDRRCCLDLRGAACARAAERTFELDWPEGARPRPRAPQCPTREITPWRVRVRAGVGVAEALRAAREASAGEELCVDLERWGSAHEIIIEDGARTWRAARAPDARARALRVVLPRIDGASRARVSVSYTVAESRESRAIEGRYEASGLRGGLLLPTTLAFETAEGEGARARLAAVTIGTRNRDAPANAELRVAPARPSLHAELWPGLLCGTSVRVLDGPRALGEALLPCPERARRGRYEDETPWVLWRFSLRDTMPEPWREAARVVRDAMEGGAVRFRSTETPSEVWLAYRGWDGVTADLRMYTSEGRTLGIERYGDDKHGHAPWRMFAGPPPPRDALCCQLDGVWSPCPNEFNDYWRCRGTVHDRPGCDDAFQRCTYIDWVAERRAQRANAAP